MFGVWRAAAEHRGSLASAAMPQPATRLSERPCRKTLTSVSHPLTSAIIAIDIPKALRDNLESQVNPTPSSSPFLSPIPTQELLDEDGEESTDRCSLLVFLPLSSTMPGRVIYTFLY